MKDKKILALVKKACKNNQDAFIQICELKAREVVFLCVREMGNTQDGEDVAQEVFIRMQKNIFNLRTPEAFNVWLNRLVYNTCVNAKRDSMKHKNNFAYNNFSEELLEDSSIILPHEYIEYNEKWKTITEVIDSLPDKYRTCLILHYYQNLTYLEISEVMEISLDAVNYTMRMARKHLKFDIENHPDMDVTNLWGATSTSLLGPALSNVLKEFALTTVPPTVVNACLANSIALGATATTKAGIFATAGISAKLITQATIAAVVVIGGASGLLIANHNSTPITPQTFIASIEKNGPVEAFDYVKEPVISGRIFILNDGTADPNARNGLSDVELQLSSFDEKSNETVLKTTHTLDGEESGYFSFHDIPPGKYRLLVSLPADANQVPSNILSLEKFPVGTGIWQVTIDNRDIFEIQEGLTDKFQNLDIAITLPATIKGRIQLYSTGTEISYQDGLFPGIHMLLLDPQEKIVGTANVTEGGDYHFDHPLVSQKGQYTIRLVSDDTSIIQVNIDDSVVELYPGYGQ